MISMDKKYYIKEEEYEITEREWDGHRGHTVGTGKYATSFLIYKKPMEGPDTFCRSFDTETKAKEWIKTKCSKATMSALKEEFNSCDACFVAQYKSLEKSLQVLQKEYKTLMQLVEKRNEVLDKCNIFDLVNEDHIYSSNIEAGLKVALFNRKKS